MNPGVVALFAGFPVISRCPVLDWTGGGDKAPLPVLPVVPLLNVPPLFPVPLFVTHVDEFTLFCT